MILKGFIEIWMQSVLQKKKVSLLIQEQERTKTTALWSIVYLSLSITKNTIWILPLQTHSPKPLIILIKTVTGKSAREKMMQQCFFCISSFPAICHPNIGEQSFLLIWWISLNADTKNLNSKKNSMKKCRKLNNQNSACNPLHPAQFCT